MRRRRLYAACAAQKRDPAVRQRLTLAAPAIVGAAQSYQMLGQTTALFQFAPPALPPGAATGDDIIDLYETTIVRKSGAGRWAYDQLKGAAPRGLCPLCAQRPVGTLDHYLPKEAHPILAVTPDNLVPACRDCNAAKGGAIAPNATSQPLHPYFDDVDDEQWLRARIIRTNGLSIEFYVGTVPAWIGLRQQRVEHHFVLFGLAPLYAAQAAEELVMRYRLEQLHQAGGAALVQDHLTQEAASRCAAHRNSWQTALYQALAGDDIFCNGEFAGA